ncbi:MAG: hypothetical protein ACTSYL_04740 [Candidatus Thorarchaeota archaeon]
MSGVGLDPEKVRYISLVRKEGGEPLLGIPYREMSVDPDLVASFVLAIIIFENRDLRTFSKEGYIVIIEEGAHTVGLLITDKIDDDRTYREALKLIINTFESRYQSQLKSWMGDIRPFREFALFIMSVFPYREINPDFVPSLIKESDATPDHRAKIPWAVGETDEKLQLVVGFINGKRTVREIIEAAELNHMEGIALFSLLDKYKWVSFKRSIRENTILKKVTEPPSLLIGAYGEQIIDIVELCDGTRTLAEIAEEVNVTPDVITTITRRLLDMGVVDFYDRAEG